MRSVVRRVVYASLEHDIVGSLASYRAEIRRVRMQQLPFIQNTLFDDAGADASINTCASAWLDADEDMNPETHAAPQPAGERAPFLALGLDPGIASCGFCLLDLANHRILEMGSHLFDPPQEPKTKVSLAQGRRSARSMRRNIKRTRDRLTHVLKLMQEEGLVEGNAKKEWFQPTRGEAQLLSLRAEGLDRLLTPREFARILYSLCSRRGYIPHGEGTSKDSDDGKVLSAIKENESRMAEGGFRTIGEMLATNGKSRNKGGAYDLCVTNAQIVDEVKALFASQREHGSEHASTEFETSYLDCLTWQKPTLDHDEKVYSLVGPCSYFPDEKRAAQADLTSEMLRAWERLAHIRLVDAAGTEHGIPFCMRKQFIDILFSPTPLKSNKDRKVTYATIRKAMDWSGRGSFKGVNADDEKKREPFEPRAWRALRNAGAPGGLLERMLEDFNMADAIGEALTYASSVPSLTERLDEIDLTDEEREFLLMKVPFSSKVFSGYGMRSRLANTMLLGAFQAEGIDTLYEAEEAVGLAQKRMDAQLERSALLPPYLEFDPTCKNPVVLRAMGRMRRIVNAIVREHGVPDVIRVELGRELKQGKKERERIAQENSKNEKERKRLAELGAEILGVSPAEVPGKTLRKLSLWEEQGNRDLYTGNKIKLERLVLDSTYCQIDHILPYSRTCDDSRTNKVLVLLKSNQDKRERSPYEWMTSGEPSAPSWEDFCARVQAASLPQRKKAHLLERNLDDERQDEFIERNLNDTRYMARAVKDYLEKSLAFPADSRDRQPWASAPGAQERSFRHVFAVAGAATANLRRAWGLNFGQAGEKDRADNRHHAVDAAVIAACDQAIVQRLARINESKHHVPKEQRAALFAESQPWPEFADAVKSARELVVPTRMANHGVTGAAFEETAYRFDGRRDDGKGQLFYRKGGATPSGNYVVGKDGNAHIVGGMAFLRLWFDPDARPKGKVKGQWYGEPVYYADLPALANGTYVPRYMKAASSRNAWPVVPEGARNRDPIYIFRGDVISINGKLGRFRNVGIAVAKWSFVDAKLGDIAQIEELRDWPTINQLGRDDHIQVVEEDVLGRCYYNLMSQL